MTTMATMATTMTTATTTTTTATTPTTPIDDYSSELEEEVSSEEEMNLPIGSEEELLIR
jgi:hypothetical protein